MVEVSDRSAVHMHYREAGIGRPVVLLHAFPVDGRLFENQLSAAETGRIPARLIAVDLPGFGQTPLDDPAPDVRTVEELAEIVAAFMVRERLAGAIVGGVAIGGYTAIELASRHPELVGGLVLFACKAAPDSPKMAAKREEVAVLALNHGSRAVADKLHGQPLGPQADGAIKAKMQAMIESADPRAIAALVRGIARRPDPAPVLSRLDVPALVVAGERDTFSALEDVRQTARLLHDAEFVIIKGVGHMAPLEAPIAVSNALAAFAKRLNAQTPEHRR